MIRMENSEQNRIKKNGERENSVSLSEILEHIKLKETQLAGTAGPSSIPNEFYF